MLKIRLQRKGKKNQPFFRIIVTEKDNPPRGGRSLELLGFLNPSTKEKQLKADRIKHWLSVGAQPSDRVHNLLVVEGIIKEKKKSVHAKSKKKEIDEKKPAPIPVNVTASKEVKSAEENKKEIKPEEKKEAKPEQKKEIKEEKPTEESVTPAPSKPALSKPEGSAKDKPIEVPEEKTEDKKEDLKDEKKE